MHSYGRSQFNKNSINTKYNYQWYFIYLKLLPIFTYILLLLCVQNLACNVSETLKKKIQNSKSKSIYRQDDDNIISLHFKTVSNHFNSLYCINTF